MRIILTALALCFACGCANINNRVFGEAPDGCSPYMCTSEAISGCTFITVPQIVNPGPMEWYWVNLVTVPIGVCCFVVDIPLEVVCDTVCLPYDLYTVRQRDKYK